MTVNSESVVLESLVVVDDNMIIVVVLNEAADNTLELPLVTMGKILLGSIETDFMKTNY